jgi:ribose 5-phosphate isomerase B
MRLYIASDHAGFELKNKLVDFLTIKKFEVVDFGAYEHDVEDDYPDFISRAAEAVSRNPEDKAIILGGSGQGEAMVANRFQNVRATVYYGGDPEIITLSREHNDANILSLGARFVDEETIFDLVLRWLTLPFSKDERHIRRIEKIDKISGRV